MLAYIYIRDTGFPCILAALWHRGCYKIGVYSCYLPLLPTPPRQVLWRSLLVVTVVAVLKASRDLSMEACALVWRQGLVSFLHCWYLRGKMPYMLSTAEAGRAKGGAYR